MVERAGEAAKLGFKAHPHMLRHACGFALANKGHDTRSLQAYLGHKNIQHTVRYTELSSDLFKVDDVTDGKLVDGAQQYACRGCRFSRGADLVFLWYQLCCIQRSPIVIFSFVRALWQFDFLVMNPLVGNETQDV